MHRRSARASSSRVPSKGSSSSSSKQPKKRALLIGLKYGQPDMIYTYDDCTKVKDLIETHFQFLEDNIKTFLDKRTREKPNQSPILTSVRLEREIKAFVEATNTGDISLLFISAHGVHPEKDPTYDRIGFIGADYKVVPVERITKAMSELNKDNKFIAVIDVCWGGGFAEMYNEKITMFLASKTMEESAGGGNGSYFTNCFADFMEKHHMLSSAELIERLKEKMRQMGCEQTPRLLSNKDNANLPVFTI
ncbi:metacaspase-1 [Trifolium medium]|uniref:Metacaspase-1 n=1 Tax=Trifolium medium TaxID=97028 RepID=A0A392MHL9_9FABA|nr:metacaspase-1 [Trifolium medium]